MRKFFEDFKAFAMRGNVIDMAVGVIIGAAFGSITTSLVNDIFMPLIGVLTGGINFGGLFIALDGGSYVSAEAAAAAGVGTINYGLFIQNIVNFILTAFCTVSYTHLVDLDNVHLPDPIKEHIVALERRVSELEEQMHNHYGTTLPKEDIEDDADL